MATRSPFVGARLPFVVLCLPGRRLSRAVAVRRAMSTAPPSRSPFADPSVAAHRLRVQHIRD